MILFYVVFVNYNSYFQLFNANSNSRTQNHVVLQNISLNSDIRTLSKILY